MKRLLLLVALGFSLAACGNDSPPPAPTVTTPPPPLQLAGIWTMTETRTSVTNGECLDGTMNATVGSTVTDTLTFTQAQNSTSLTAVTTAQANGISCNWTGTADTDRFVLNLSFCQTNANQFGLRCANGAVRDLRIASSLISIVRSNGNYTGTKADTYNVTGSGGFPQVGTMSFNANVTMTK